MSTLPPSSSVFSFLLFLISALLRFGSADEFTSPSNSKADLSVQYTIGETVQLSWNTSLSPITLLVSHWGGNTVGSLLSDASNPNVYTWTIGQTDNVNDQQISQSPNFVLLIRDPSGKVGTGGGYVDNQLSSRAFIIKSNVTTTSSTASSTATSASSTQPPVTVTATAATTPTSTPTSIPSPGLSTGAKAGIGIGCGLLSLIFFALGAFFWRRKTTKRRLQQSEVSAVPHTTGGLYEAADPTPVLNKKLYFHRAPPVRYAQDHHGGAQAPTELPLSGPWNTSTTPIVHEIDGRGHEGRS